MVIMKKLKHVLTFKVTLVFLLMMTFFCPICPNAFARQNDYRGNNRNENRVESRGDNRVENRSYNKKYIKEYNRGERYYYRGGNWHKSGWFGFGAVVSALAIGAFIEALPPNHQTVVVEGNSYYHDDRYYYRPLPEGGYVVVSTPVVVQTQFPIPATSIINIPNSRGGYTSITLIRSGNGFVGPQGEYYQSYPSVEQLREMYGG
jgi:hypothetical protein